MLKRESFANGQDVIRDTENGQVVQWLDKDDPTPDFVRENPSQENPSQDVNEADLGTEHRAKNPAPAELVTVEGKKKNPSHHSTHNQEESDMEEKSRMNALMGMSDELQTVLVSSTSALGGEMVASELVDQVDQNLLSNQSDTVRKASSVLVPVAGTAATLSISRAEWAQSAAVGMLLAGVRNGLKIALPNSAPVQLGENSSADLSGSARRVASGQRTRQLQGRTQGRTQRGRSSSARQIARTAASGGLQGDFSADRRGGVDTDAQEGQDFVSAVA
jgi:hypothetical protein